MNPLDYCLQQAAPPGSPIYYALRYASPAQRALFAPLYALRQECEDTVTQASEPAVAQTKLAWWEQEIAKAAGGSSMSPALGQSPTPSHPITLALAAAPGMWLPRLAPLLIAVVGAYREDLEKARYLDFDALLRHLGASSGRIAGILAYCAEKAEKADNGHAAHAEAMPITATPPHADAASTSRETGIDTALDDADLPEWAVSLGTATRLAHLTASIGDHARHGRIYLPVNDMQSHEVPASDVLNRRYTPAMKTLLLEQASRSQRLLRDARTAAAALSRTRKRRQRALLAEAAMAQRLLDEIIRDGMPVLHQKIALTPVRNLLVSWWATL